MFADEEDAVGVDDTARNTDVAPRHRVDGCCAATGGGTGTPLGSFKYTPAIVGETCTPGTTAGSVSLQQELTVCCLEPTAGSTYASGVGFNTLDLNDLVASLTNVALFITWFAGVLLAAAAMRKRNGAVPTIALVACIVPIVGLLAG